MDEEKYNKMIALIADQLELKNDISKKFIKEALDDIIKFDQKHTEKGAGNHSKFGPLGIVIRVDDLVSSLSSHYQNAYPEIEKERVKKIWEDLSIYSIMGKLIESGKWDS